MGEIKGILRGFFFLNHRTLESSLSALFSLSLILYDSPFLYTLE